MTCWTQYFVVRAIVLAQRDGETPPDMPFTLPLRGLGGWQGVL